MCKATTLLTRNRMGLLLYQISSTYLTNRTHGPVEVDHWWMHVAYPEEGLDDLFWRVFTATHLAVIEQIQSSAFPPNKPAHLIHRPRGGGCCGHCRDLLDGA